MIHISLIQFFPQKLNGLSEALEMDQLPLPEEFNHIVYIRIVGKAQDVVIGCACFLLCCNPANTTETPDKPFPSEK